MKYLLKVLKNKEYNDYFFITTDISNNDVILSYHTRIERLNNIGVENKILYSVTAPNYKDALKGMIAFHNHRNIFSTKLH